MDFLHQSFDLRAGDSVVLDCNTQCNFMLLDDHNFHAYQSGGGFKYFGGHFKRFPARITAPSTNRWHAVVDIGGSRATIRYSLRVLKSA